MCVLTWPQHEAVRGQRGARSQQLAWPPQSPAVPMQPPPLHSFQGPCPEPSLGCTNTSVLLQLPSFSRFHVRSLTWLLGQLWAAWDLSWPTPATTGTCHHWDVPLWNLSPPESIIAGTCPKQPAAAGTSLC